MEFAQGLLSTRRGSTVLGIVAAGIAGILLLLYISQYRDSVNSSNKSVQVIVARSLIQKGTPGDVIGSGGFFQATSVAKPKSATRRPASGFPASKPPKPKSASRPSTTCPPRRSSCAAPATPRARCSRGR